MTLVQGKGAFFFETGNVFAAYLTHFRLVMEWQRRGFVQRMLFFGHSFMMDVVGSFHMDCLKVQLELKETVEM